MLIQVAHCMNSTLNHLILASGFLTQILAPGSLNLAFLLAVTPVLNLISDVTPGLENGLRNITLLVQFLHGSPWDGWTDEVWATKTSQNFSMILEA